MTELDMAPDETLDEELARVLTSSHESDVVVPDGDNEKTAATADVPDEPVTAINGAAVENVKTARPNRLRSLARSARLLLSGRRSSIATWTGGAMCAVALFCVLFVGYVAAFSRVEMTRSQTHLIAALNGTGGLASLTAAVPADGAPAGILTIPAIGLHDVVVAGTSAQDLEEGPGYLLGSAPPGTRGNTVIAGKRASYGGPFGGIGSLRPGDSIQLVSSLGAFTYKVEQAGTALPGWRDPAGPVDRAQLTLVTADSSLLPSGVEYVVAKLAGKPVAYVSPKAIVPPAGNLGLSGDGGLILPTLVWLLVLAAAGVATVIGVRRCRKSVIVYVMAVPVLLALSMVVFHDLSGLLPATL